MSNSALSDAPQAWLEAHPGWVAAPDEDEEMEMEPEPEEPPPPKPGPPRDINDLTEEERAMTVIAKAKTEDDIDEYKKMGEANYYRYCHRTRVLVTVLASQIHKVG